ncbi:MAG TPA: TetR family transcriptional regulator [Solirubrobacteraceae bacterium]|nr:TetR family transcriptional regulator [Solirubrobacteraceae bacterium]
MTERAGAKRRRRRPEEAEAEILAAAEEALRELPWHEVTVARLMDRTTLSRKSFYVYFRDRNELLTRLMARLRGQIDGIADGWRQGADDPDAGRRALMRLARLYAEHGHVLRALGQAALEDPEARRTWDAFVEAADRRSAQRIRADVAAGRASPDLDPESTARALCAMNREYLLATVAERPGADLEQAVDTLQRIWRRTLYGE